jgi:SAM-dependent methyltransferase
VSDNRDSVHNWAREAGSGTSNRYHPFAPRGLYGQSYLRERFVRLIVENAIPLDQMEILDLGCGTGTWCRYFAELKGTMEGIVGVDLSEERLAVARSLSPIEYVQGDITDLSGLIDRQFDLVSAFVSLMFLRDRHELRSVFMSVRELLRPGGYFVVYERDEMHGASAPSGWPLSELMQDLSAMGLAPIAHRRLYKVLLGILDPSQRMTFGSADLVPALERFVPGRWAGYMIVAKRDPA